MNEEDPEAYYWKKWFFIPFSSFKWTHGDEDYDNSGYYPKPNTSRPADKLMDLDHVLKNLREVAFTFKDKNGSMTMRYIDFEMRCSPEMCGPYVGP